MAKKPVRKQEVNFLGYVRTHVDEVAKTWVAQNLLKEEQIGSCIVRWSSQGFKVSLQYREDDQAFTAGLYCFEPGHENAGLMLTARHSDPVKAITLLKYLHEIKFDGSWPAYEDSRQNLDW